MANETSLGFAGDHALGNAFVLSGRAVFDTAHEASAHSAILSGDVTGSGALVKINSGTLVLAGVNTYEGDTVVSAGTLKVAGFLGYGAASGGSAVHSGNFVNADTLEFDQSGHQTLAGAITGSGTLVKNGSGVLEIAATLGSGVTSGGSAYVSFVHSGAIINSGVLRFNQSGFEQVLAGVLGGDGALIKDGAERLILNHFDSANSAGTVHVGAGSFIVGGTPAHSAVTLFVTSGVTVQGRGDDDRASLGGHGTIVGNVTLGSDSVLSPGNSYGTLNIVGNVVFDEKSHYDVEIDLDHPENGDLTYIAGTADLTGGTVYYLADTSGTAPPESDWLGKEWTILSAEGGLGETRFAGVESSVPLAYLKPELKYALADTEVVLYFLKKATFSDGCATWNTCATAGALDAMNPGNSLYGELLGNVPEGEEQRVLNELSGEIHATLNGLLARRDEAFTRRFVRHAGDASAGSVQGGTSSKGLWIGVDQAHAAADGNRNAAYARWTGTEVAFGHDAEFDAGWLGGFAFGFNEGQQEVKGRRSEAGVRSGTAALYAGREIPLDGGRLRVLFTGAQTRHEVDSKRHVKIGSNDQKLEASYAGNAFTGTVETAYRISPTEKFLVEPYASLAWHTLRLDGFTEKGGSAALRKSKETQNRTTSTLGVRLSTPLQKRVTFDADVGWRHLYGSATPKSVFVFDSDKDYNTFKIRGADVNRNAAVLGLGVGVAVGKNAKLSLQYDGELGSRGKSHGGRVVFEMKW
jgi:outer membrane autotransporter protein